MGSSALLGCDQPGGTACYYKGMRVCKPHSIPTSLALCTLTYPLASPSYPAHNSSRSNGSYGPETSSWGNFVTKAKVRGQSGVGDGLCLYLGLSPEQGL